MTPNPTPNNETQHLKVLCILTFIGSGIVLVWSLYSIVNIVFITGSLGSSDDLLGLIGFFFQILLKLLLVNYIFFAFGAFFALIGAIMMWKLRKIGFYLYLIGQIIPIIGGLVMVLFISRFEYAQIFFKIIITINFVGLLLSIIFIVLYSKNLKHLTKKNGNRIN